MMIKPLLSAAIGLVLAAATPASAAMITYTVSGSFLDESGIVSAVTVSAIGDTDLATSVPADTDPVTFVTLVPVSQITTIINGATETSDEGGSFFSFAELGLSGVEAADLSHALSFQSLGLIGYDGTTTIGPVNVTVVLALLSRDGTLEAFTPQGPSVFSATLADVSPIPEPATWAMMIAGFGLVGGTMRRRTLVTA